MLVASTIVSVLIASSTLILSSRFYKQLQLVAGFLLGLLPSGFMLYKYTQKKI